MLFKTKVAIFVFICRILYSLGTRCVEEKSSSYLFLSTLHRASSSGDQQIAGRDLDDCVQDLMGMKLEVLVFVQQTESCHAQIMGQVPAKSRGNVKIMFSAETKLYSQILRSAPNPICPLCQGLFWRLTVCHVEPIWTGSRTAGTFHSSSPSPSVLIMTSWHRTWTGIEFLENVSN